jgi:hypothetical protein
MKILMMIYPRFVDWISDIEIIMLRRYMKIKSKHFGWCENRGYIAETATIGSGLRPGIIPWKD